MGEQTAAAEAVITSLRGVTESFGSHTVLQDISFDVPRGRIACILGVRNRQVGLAEEHHRAPHARRGEIWVDGEQVVAMGEKDLYRVRRKFGVLFQDGALFGSMNLYDNIAFPLREHTKKGDREIREIVREKAGFVGLLDHVKKTPGEVSGVRRSGLDWPGPSSWIPRSCSSTNPTRVLTLCEWLTSTNWSSTTSARPAPPFSSSPTTSHP